jgi:hypothetical protein
MKRVLIGLAMGVLAAVGCSHGVKETASRSWDTTVEGAKTAGTATVEGAKTVGGTTRGLVKGGTKGAAEEYNVGAETTANKTKSKAADTAAAAHGEPH